MEMVEKGQPAGRYFACPGRCSLGRTRVSQVSPECRWCSIPMRLHVGRQEEWKGVAVWWCEEHRFGPVPASKPPQKNRPKPSPKKRTKPSERERDEWLSQRDRFKSRKKAPKKGRVINVPHTGEPLGNRSVPPGSMYKSRDGYE